MTVKAKFFCEYVKEMTWGSEVALRAVTRGEDNKEWSSATPTGTFVMGIKNEVAAAQFKAGKEYLIDINEVPEALAGKEGMDSA